METMRRSAQVMSRRSEPGPLSNTVDVVIPCYNYAAYLPACVKSVLLQTGVRLRILIIDDASSDDTARVGRQIAATNAPVEYRRHDKNQGNIATYNEGLLDWSKAQYVVLISADDMLAPGSLRRAVQIMNCDERIGMVYGPTVHFTDEAELPKTDVQDYSFTRFSGTEWLRVRCAAGHNVITSPEVVVRGAVQRAVGGYRADLPHAGDLEMWLRIAAVADLGYIRGVPQAFYRVHSANMTKSRTSFIDLRQRMAAFNVFFHHHQDRADAEVLHSLASRAIACEALWDACRAYDRDELADAHADELVEFALASYAAARDLPEYRALQRRRALGAFLCSRTQLFAFPALSRRLKRSMSRWRWQRTGI